MTKNFRIRNKHPALLFIRYSRDTVRKEVWIYDPLNGFHQTKGPSLIIARSSHSCSIMNDGEKNFIIVAGGYPGRNFPYLNTVEIYDPTDKIWHQGYTIFSTCNNKSTTFYRYRKIANRSLSSIILFWCG